MAVDGAPAVSAEDPSYTSDPTGPRWGYQPAQYCSKNCPASPQSNEQYWWGITNPDGSARPAYTALKAFLNP